MRFFHFTAGVSFGVLFFPYCCVLYFPFLYPIDVTVTFLSYTYRLEKNIKKIYKSAFIRQGKTDKKFFLHIRFNRENGSLDVTVTRTVILLYLGSEAGGG
jgi:hypothetical protein